MSPTVEIIININFHGRYSQNSLAKCWGGGGSTGLVFHQEERMGSNYSIGGRMGSNASKLFQLLQNLVKKKKNQIKFCI